MPDTKLTQREPTAEMLAACPFCGKTDEPGRFDRVDFGNWRGIVHCTWCGAVGPYPQLGGAKSAEAAWNTRAASSPEPLPAGDVEMVEAVARGIYEQQRAMFDGEGVSPEWAGLSAEQIEQGCLIGAAAIRAMQHASRHPTLDPAGEAVTPPVDLAVTLEDRDAAADYLNRTVLFDSRALARAVRAGKRDGDSIVQAFRNHRLRALASSRDGREAGLRRLVSFRPTASETFSYQADGYATGWNAAIAGFQDEVRRILALIDQPRQKEEG